MTGAAIQTRSTDAANQRHRTILAPEVGVTVAIVVVNLVDAGAIVTGIIAIAFVNIDLTVGALKARIALTGIGADLLDEYGLNESAF